MAFNKPFIGQHLTGQVVAVDHVFVPVVIVVVTYTLVTLTAAQCN